MDKAVIFDVDGTLCDVRSIRHFLDTGKRNFHRFHQESTACPPVDVVAGLWRSIRPGIKRVVVTAREARWYNETLWWMLLNGFEPDDMFMRPWRDFRPDWQVKADMLVELRNRYELVLAVDDNPNVIDVWTRAGIRTLVIPGWGP